MITEVHRDGKLVGWDAVCGVGDGRTFGGCREKFFVRKVPVYLAEPNTAEMKHIGEGHGFYCHECLMGQEQAEGNSPESFQAYHENEAKRLYG